MRISDWSSDVCSSDLDRPVDEQRDADALPVLLHRSKRAEIDLQQHGNDHQPDQDRHDEIDACDLGGGYGGEQAGHRIAKANAYNDAQRRSEEHTSELQSLMRHSYAVFCLQKKKHTLP